jgi:hypothetical protein
MSNKVIFTFVNINTTLAYLQKYQVVCTSHRITENSDQVRAMPDSSVLPVGKKKMNDVCLHLDEDTTTQKIPRK